MDGDTFLRERGKLDILVDRFSAALRGKLSRSLEKGRTGWDDPEWPVSEIRTRLVEHIGKGDPLDVAAFCAFLWHREESTALSKPLSNDPAPDCQLGTVERYLIWSNEHRAWWRPNNAGYTVYVTAAGIYSKEDALSTSWKGRDGWRSEQQCPAEIAVPLSSIPEHYRPTE